MLLVAELDLRDFELALAFDEGLVGAVDHDVRNLGIGEQFLERPQPEQFVDQHLFERELLAPVERQLPLRSEEHTSDLQTLMRNSYAGFCLKQKKHYQNYNKVNQ